MSDKQHPSVTLSRCVSATQYLPAAILLFHLYGWDMWRQKNRPDGWVRKSLEELAKETNLTPKQVKDGLKRLKEKMLIESVLIPYKGRNHAHYRTTPRSHMVLRPQSQTGPCDSPKKDHVYEHENKHVNEQEKHITGEQVHPSSGDTPMPPFKKKSFTMSQVANGSAPEKINPPKAPLKSASVAQIAYLWRETYAEVYGEMTHLSSKEVGMLKAIFKHVPFTEAPKIVETCLRNWTEFCEEVYPLLDKKQKTPSKPTVGFFVAWISSAINFTQSYKPLPVKAPIKADPVKTKAPDKAPQTEYTPYTPADLSGSDFFGDD